MNAEVSNIEGFKESGDKYASLVAYRLIHEVLPGLVLDDFGPCKKLIFDHRWNMGSIKNCSFVYPRMIEIAESLRDLRDDKRVDIISLSSVGPSFFGITRDPIYLEKRFVEQGMTVISTTIHNGIYVVL